MLFSTFAVLSIRNRNVTVVKQKAVRQKLLKFDIWDIEYQTIIWSYNTYDQSFPLSWPADRKTLIDDHHHGVNNCLGMKKHLLVSLVSRCLQLVWTGLMMSDVEWAPPTVGVPIGLFCPLA